MEKLFPIEKPDWDQFFSSRLAMIWVGHATSLVRLDGLTFLMDPIFSERCSPVQWFGPKRFRPVPFTIAELAAACRAHGAAGVDAVFISHNHYDHLDRCSIHELARTFPQCRFYVPLGLRDWMVCEGCGRDRVTELTWWQDVALKPNASGGLPEGNKSYRVICVPAQHWTARNLLFDRSRCLWGGWIVESPAASLRFYFTGDTGYSSKLFPAIGAHYGPMSLCAIPIGAFHPRRLLGAMHVAPEQSVQIHRDVRSEHSVGVHWGTFLLGGEQVEDPPRVLHESLVEARVPTDAFVTVRHGAVHVVKHWCLISICHNLCFFCIAHLSNILWTNTLCNVVLTSFHACA